MKESLSNHKRHVRCIIKPMCIKNVASGWSLRGALTKPVATYVLAQQSA